MNGLTHEQLATLHSALQQRKQLLDEQLALVGVGPAVEEVETSPADSASNRTLNQLYQGTAGHQSAQLAAVKHALAKFDEGEYGSCENCGLDIAYSRLQARPEATLCIACQERRERKAMG